MARTSAGNQLTVGHRSRQLALRAATLRDITRLWALWDGTRVAGFSRFAALAEVLTRDRFLTSAGLAVAYYQAFRLAESIPGTGTPQLAEPPTTDHVVGNLRATGLAGTMRAIRSGFSPSAAKQTGLVQVMGSVGRMVMLGGNQTLVASADADRQAVGWRRVTGSDPCKFCRDLSTVTFTADRAEFQAHDHDACSTEPIY